MAYQRISPDEKTKDDVTIEGEAKQVEEECKSIKTIKKGEKIHGNVDIVDISNEYETTPLS